MSTVFTIIVAILFFGVLIFIHELGHFIAAKLNGVGVYEFSLGMGPKLFSVKRRETAYSLRLFPIGGYVKMVGEDEEAYSPDSFSQKSVWRRLTVLFAGPFMNFVLAIIVFVIIYSLIGAVDTNKIGTVVADSPAAVAGIMDGDVIKSINGKKINNWYAVQNTMQTVSDGTAVPVVVLRGGTEMTFSVTPYYGPVNEDDNYPWKIGITNAVVRYNFFTAIGIGFQQTYEFTKQLLVALFQMITGQIPAEVTGPVGIVNILGDAIQANIRTVLMLLAILSINLGVVNLLPLPALDGGRMVFLLVEGVRGKPMNPEREGMVHFIGLLALFALMIIITYQDIARLITGG